MIYQDNPPYGYYYQPAIGYGYQRDDGVREPSCATWNARSSCDGSCTSPSPAAATTPPPASTPTSAARRKPGRSFCFRGLTGEYLESDRIPLGMLRVWLSQQWGMNIDWLMQEPNAGATLAYWRALCSRLFLLDVTSFSRWDSADQASCWLAALDLFWLDDPTLVWHPYFRNPTLKSRSAPRLRLHLHRQGPRLVVISNQARG